VLPRRHELEEHALDIAGGALLTAVLLLMLIPLVDGRVSGWPPWSWLKLAASVPAGAALVAWEFRLARHGGEPVLQVNLLRHRSFATGQALALLYFAGFTSLFFTLSIPWQQGLGRSALATGLLVLPFAVASLSTASNSYRFSIRFGRKAVQGGLAAMFAGLALMLLVLHLSAPRPDVWLLIGPLFLAGLGNGLVIAPNQDFVLGSVPRSQAGNPSPDPGWRSSWPNGHVSSLAAVGSPASSANTGISETSAAAASPLGASGATARAHGSWCRNSAWRKRLITAT